MTCGGDDGAQRKTVEKRQVGIKIRITVVSLIKSDTSIGALD